MTKIKLSDWVGDFAGDKDVAALIRDRELRPALLSDETKVEIDFEDVSLATQSFVHALISQLVREPDLDALKRITFTNCSPSVQELIEIVAEYSQENVAEPGD
jgi:hypothetical protein